MQDILKTAVEKLTSRKFLVTAAGVAMGLAVSFGINADELRAIVGTIVSAASCITYVLTEGRIDMQKLKAAVKEADAIAKDLAKSNSVFEEKEDK